ncbi:hypothetical protein ABVT39_011630 [Epinephelus coioides]
MSQVDLRSGEQKPCGGYCEARHKCIAFAALCEIEEQEFEGKHSDKAKDSNKDHIKALHFLIHS